MAYLFFSMDVLKMILNKSKIKKIVEGYYNVYEMKYKNINSDIEIYYMSIDVNNNIIVMYNNRCILNEQTHDIEILKYMK